EEVTAVPDRGLLDIRNMGSTTIATLRMIAARGCVDTASGPVTLSEYHARAFQIDISSYDKVKAEDKGSRDVWKKKGNIRVWFCKNEPYRNEILRMKIKFRWYLWLYFDLKR
ncbi:MAG: hypothetical protein ACXVI6_03680, partial [Candidatus Aminicenantales bacterium]